MGGISSTVVDVWGWDGRDQQHSSGCVGEGWDECVGVGWVGSAAGGMGGISSPVVDVWGWDGRDQQHSSGCVGVGWEGSAAQ